MYNVIEPDFDDIEWFESEAADEEDAEDEEKNVDQDDEDADGDEEEVDELESEETEDNNTDERENHRGHGMRWRKKIHRRKHMMRKDSDGPAGGRRRPMHGMHGKPRGPGGRHNYWQFLRERFNKTKSDSLERWRMVYNKSRSHWANIRQQIMKNRMKFNESSSNQTDRHSFHGHHHRRVTYSIIIIAISWTLVYFDSHNFCSYVYILHSPLVQE